VRNFKKRQRGTTVRWISHLAYASVCDCADFARGDLQLRPDTSHNIVNDCVDVVNQGMTLFVQLKS
jgi:hypothetical protein